MQQRGWAFYSQAMKVAHRVLLDFGFRLLKRPLGMVDLVAPDRAVRPGGIEAIALREPMLQRSRSGGVDLRDRPVAAGEGCMRAPRFVVERAVRKVHGHPGEVI